MIPPRIHPRFPLRSGRWSRRGILRDLAGATTLLAAAGWAPPRARARAQSQAGGNVTPVTGHPRLWLTADDLPRLREWARESNPIWQEGILLRAESAVANMNAGLVPNEDLGANGWDPYPTEVYAAFFAFLSLIHPDEAAREDYGERAHTLLMYAITEAAKGPAPNERFRDPDFATFDRSRWSGECFPITVDWIYDRFLADEKATIRDVFQRWVDENMVATTSGELNHPEPQGVVNDPVLLENPIAVRWAGNNYFTAHMRNIGLMALALDPADDPAGSLTGAVEHAAGAWLYMVDSLLRGDSRGGLPAEGFEYSPQAIAYVVQFILALHTAGRDDPALLGPQVVLNDNPFWNEIIPAHLNSLSPLPVTIANPDWSWLGDVYQPAWYGDGALYWAPSFIGVYGALGRYDELTGNTARLDTMRWIQLNLSPGGPELQTTRMADGEAFLDAVWTFLLFDPDAPAPTDPHPATPRAHFAAGLGRYLHRTSWEADTTWFTYALGWNTVDHQHSDGNQFEFYRQGEWLTKERTGYGFNIGASDYHNTLALENNVPINNDYYMAIMGSRGSQWMYIPAGDPTIVAQSTGDDLVYFLGDATNLYNCPNEGATDILHASRSIVWLPPDHIVIYDRAVSQTDGRFKRFWLNLPTNADVAGNVSTMTTDAGQQLVVTTLLPVDAQIASEPAEPLEEEQEPAINEPMRFRLRVEASGGPATARFLHVLQGADAGTATDVPLLIESTDGAPFAGAVVGATVVLFPVAIDTPADTVSYAVPEGTARHLITGLTPDSGYDVTLLRQNDQQQVTIQPGAGLRADGGGVLRLDVPV